MATTTRDAIEELLQTYGETGGINYLAAAASLPSRLSIEAACTELMSLMFPGFRSEALVSSEDLADTTRIRVRHLHARLKTEICRSLGKIPPDQATEAKAEEVLAEFFKQLPSVRRMLWTDIDAAYEGDPAATTYEEIILAYPSLEAIAIYRMAHLLYGKVPLIPRIMTEWAHSRTGMNIDPSAAVRPFGHDARNQRHLSVEQMRHSINGDRLQRRISEDDFLISRRGRVPFVRGIDICPKHAAHRWQLLERLRQYFFGFCFRCLIRGNSAQASANFGFESRV